MKLTKCDHGHYYDADKYPGCPYCDASLRGADGAEIAAAGGDAPDEGAAAAAPAGPVSGWLVVLSGAARGQDLRLGVGRTVLGLNAAGAPVTLSPDSPLSARLAAVIYDPAAAAFTLLPGTAQALAYLNGAAVLEPKPLAAGDIVTLGGAALVFVPFCGPQFGWQTPEQAAPKAPAAPRPQPVKPGPIPAVEEPEPEKKPAAKKPAEEKKPTEEKKPAAKKQPARKAPAKGPAAKAK